MGGKKSNHIRRILASVKGVRTWQLVIILIPMLFLAATLLRFDHIKMSELRQDVLIADEVGDAAGIEASLAKLQEYVFTHIVVNVVEENGKQKIIFGTGPFYLENSYIRAANAAIEAAENTLVDDSNPNGNIYEAVRQICQPLALQNGWNSHQQEYLDCWTSELAKYPASETLTPVIVAADLPSTELYRRSYASPLWAPTPAGFVILACVILLVIIVIRFLIWLILKIALFVVEHLPKKQKS